MSNTPEFNTEQLSAARATSWHQSADPLLTLDSVRDFLTASGILLFAPRPLQLPAPAPSLIEATLGAPNPGPTASQIDTARSLVARLVAEGNALPLNLLGIPGDLPDFVVSAQVFSFIYTLRGDKAWKQPPSATGATKASPLGIRIYEILAEKGALSAAEIATEAGRELTESAIQRSLTELWSNLRVIPLLPQQAGPTLWELTSRRFTKAIKAGINAGQPTALSALISLYLAQTLLATEDEVETFLSPLAARSRIREVLHALTGSRQLETIVLEGKSLLHIPGTLPEFPTIEKPEPTEGELAAASAATLEGEGRIKRFNSSSERRAFGDFKGKPARALLGGGTRPTPRFGAGKFGAKPAFGSAKPAFGTKPDGERRPFTRASAEAKPTFTKPWEEDHKPAAEAAEGEAPKRPYTPRAANAGSSFAKKPYTPREGRPTPAGFAKRPYTPRTEGDSPAGKRPYTPRGASAGSSFAKKPFVRGEGATTGSYPKRPYTPREGASDRPARPSSGGDRPSFGAKRPFTPRDGDSSRPSRPPFGAARPSFGAKRPYAPRGASSRGEGQRPDSYQPGATPQDSRPYRSEGQRPDSSFAGARTPYERKPFVRRESSASSERPPRPSFGAKKSFGDKADSFTKFRKFDAPKRPFTPREGGRPDKPAYGGSDSKPRAPKEPKFDAAPKRPFPRKEGDLADRPTRPWPEKTGRSDGRPGGPGSKPRGPRKDFGDRPARPSSFEGGAKRSFGAKPAFRSGAKSGGFSKRPAATGDKVSFGSKPAPRRGTPGTKPSFPRKPRPSTEE